MKRAFPLIVPALIFAALPFAGCSKKSVQAETAQTAVIQSNDQKVSYGIGHNIGSSLEHDKTVNIDQAALLAGITDGLTKAKPRVPDAEIEAAFNAVREKAMTTMAAEAEKQLAAGKAYLEKNKTRPGVKVTASGLQYEVLKSGSGPKPTTASTVKVHYHGTLIDGTVFDSSVQRGEPIEFPLTGVIQGWVEALQLMSVGDKWRLTIPSEIAYGSRGKGDIPPNAVLVFEVELLEIK